MLVETGRRSTHDSRARAARARPTYTSGNRKIRDCTNAGGSPHPSRSADTTGRRTHPSTFASALQGRAGLCSPCAALAPFRRLAARELFASVGRVPVPVLGRSWGLGRRPEARPLVATVVAGPPLLKNWNGEGSLSVSPRLPHRRGIYTGVAHRLPKLRRVHHRLGCLAGVAERLSVTRAEKLPCQ
jgi:hypothetical protein